MRINVFIFVEQLQINLSENRTQEASKKKKNSRVGL